ncbi:LysR family transcriptional regulator [Aestuariirhabdus litorea]|uniref:LysR family transcriptional regulator n=1 Tax=Aestuariirhabdus litorea TaxID=2528527 RepID=A0A3P3VLY6_9GAMM|nr:LysR family transcriptional regulator [Aestuariirhabdus litorea]RRJ82888.1 LysR family transcriptional regulator [Aestuariirhabdus litorea]RWW93047.1 LysR family transcriptional regulator [Endozoicomonadaceae bacterium GTF-13]
MDLKRLRYFTELASIGNFTLAASRLGIAQPALSMAMQKLEQEVGLKLINRTERRMTITADGEVLLRYARQVLQLMSDAERELQAQKGVEQGVIRLGVSAMLASYYLPEHLLGFCKRYPGVRITLFEAGTATLERMVLEGELDLALLRTDRPHEQIRSRPLIEEQIVACVPAGHPLAAQPSVSLAEVTDQPLVLFREGYFLREALSEYSRSARKPLDIRFETNLIELLKRLVREGVGISTCLSMILESESDLCALPFDPPIALPIGIGWKRNHYLSRAAEALVNYLQTPSKG